MTMTSVWTSHMTQRKVEMNASSHTLVSDLFWFKWTCTLIRQYKTSGNLKGKYVFQATWIRPLAVNFVSDLSFSSPVWLRKASHAKLRIFFSFFSHLSFNHHKDESRITHGINCKFVPCSLRLTRHENSFYFIYIFYSRKLCNGFSLPVDMPVFIFLCAFRGYWVVSIFRECKLRYNDPSSAWLRQLDGVDPYLPAKRQYVPVVQAPLHKCHKVSIKVGYNRSGNDTVSNVIAQTSNQQLS